MTGNSMNATSAHGTPSRLRLLFIVRHGERRDRQGAGTARAWQEECEPRHAHDPPLSDEGVSQATRTGQCIAAICASLHPSLDVAVVSSPLRRCAQTAQCIVAALKASTFTSPDGDDSAAADRASSGAVSLELTTGLYELMTEELFPVGPSFAVSPHFDVSDVHAVDDSVRIVERYPESKPQSTTRTIAALQARWPLLSQTADVVVVVAHQFNCRVLTSHLVSQMQQQQVTQWCGDAGGVSDSTHGRRPKHTDWKQAVRSLMSASRREECSLGIPEQTGLHSLDFDVCSMTLFEFGAATSGDASRDAAAAPGAPDAMLPARGVPTQLHLASYVGHLAAHPST